jgi:hypothetical protein
MVGIVAGSTVWPPSRLRTLMEESVRFATERVPACVGLRVAGGGRDVKSGFQRMELAVVSWLAMCSCGGVLMRETSEGFGWAVLLRGMRPRGGYRGLNK